MLAELSAVDERGQPLRRTFVFTDIVDSTPLVAAMGNEQWTAVLAWHNKAVCDLLEAHEGEEVKERGGDDGLFPPSLVPMTRSPVPRPPTATILRDRLLPDDRMNPSGNSRVFDRSGCG